VTSYGLAVFASMLVAITVTPALSLILLARAPLERRGSPVMRALQRGYTAVLARVIRRPGPALALTAVVLGAGLLAYPALGESLFPAFKQRDFLMHFMTKPGTSHEEEMRMVERVSRETRAIPGIQHFGSHVGRAVQGEEINGINFAENWISISPHADYQKTLNALDALSASHAGMFSNVETYLNERIEEVLAGTSDAVVIRIFGPNLRTLHDTAASVQRALTPIRGIEDLHTEVQTMIPHVQVLPKPLQDARYGLKPGDIRRASNALLSGDEVSDIHRDSKVNDIIVWSTPETRNSVDAIRRLPIDTPSGRRVRLEDAAYVRILPTPNQISRENGSRRIDVMLNPGSRDLGSVVSEVKSRLAGVRFPLGYHARLLGEFQERQGAQNRILIFGIAAAIGILLMLQVCFRSWRAALLSFVTLPFALVGGVLAAYATGGVISMGSLVGFLTVFGIAARNGILMINHFQHLEEHEGEPFGPGLVLRGARERLAPIVMTALATGLALVPLVAAGEIPGAEIEYPMAIVILGGLVTSTVLNLFVVPSLYLRFARPRAGLPAGPATPA
jgi:Cu/Ag efflux pump CusA